MSRESRDAPSGAFATLILQKCVAAAGEHGSGDEAEAEEAELATLVARVQVSTTSRGLAQCAAGDTRESLPQGS